MLTRLRSLQARLLALVLGVVVLVWAGASLLTARDARRELDHLLDAHLAQAAALVVAQQVRELGEDHDFAGHRGTEVDDDRIDAPTLHRYAPQAFFQVFHGGRLTLRSGSAPEQPLAAAGSGFSTVTVNGERWRVFAARGADLDVQVFVGEREHAREHLLQAVLRGTLWPMGVALPVLALAVAWGVHRGLGPLRRLGEQLAARRAAVLDPVVLPDTPTEMAPMLAALNGLFERVRELLDAERRFTADAAHELRTPIAAIRAQAQVALAEAEPAARRLALQHTLAGCDRATRLVEQLLTLARLEADAAPPLQPLALTALVRSVLADAAPAALARSQALELEAGADARVAGEPVLLAVLVRNLVDNALRYSPPGARVAVRVAAQGDRVVLDVEDNGPGLADAELERLGERFFRVTGTGATGSGLGWSIVRRIAGVHGATLEARRSAALGGLAVRVAFPRAD